MTILDLIKKTAVIFNIEKILDDTNIDSITNSTQTTVLDSNSQLNRLYELSKIVLCEVYSCVNKEVEMTVSTTNCQIDKRILGSVGRVVLIKNQYGKVNYQVDGNLIIVDKDGEYTIKCIVVPNTKYLINEIDMLNGSIGEDLLINGLNAYYCLSSGLFEEYNVFNGRYIDGLSRLNNSKLFAMPCRSWHE